MYSHVYTCIIYLSTSINTSVRSNYSCTRTQLLIKLYYSPANCFMFGFRCRFIDLPQLVRLVLAQQAEKRVKELRHSYTDGEPVENAVILRAHCSDG